MLCLGNEDKCDDNFAKVFVFFPIRHCVVLSGDLTLSRAAIHFAGVTVIADF